MVTRRIPYGGWDDFPTHIGKIMEATWWAVRHCAFLNSRSSLKDPALKAFMGVRRPFYAIIRSRGKRGE